MRTAVVVAMTVACFAAQEQVRAGSDATQPAEQTDVLDALAAAEEQVKENMPDQLRIVLQEHSEFPIGDEDWGQFVLRAKAEYDDRAWGWLQESVDVPGTVASLREAHPDFPTYHLEWARIATEIDAGVIGASGSSATADGVALSAMRQLLRNTSAELLTLTGRFFVPEYAVLPDDVHDLDHSDEAMAWTRFADTIRPHEELEPFPGYNAIQKLQAVYAAADNKLAMETHHLDGYDLLNMAGYQVAQRLMLAAMIDIAAICATGESCREGEQCEALAEAGPRTCETAAGFCRASQQADRLGICDAFPRRCEYAVECVQRTAFGSDADGNCIVDSWEALRSSEFPSPLEGVASSDGDGGVPTTP